MDIDKLSSFGSRLFFAAAATLFAIAIVEFGLSQFHVVQRLEWNPGRLIEFGTMFLVPVVAVLLRQIREELRKQKHG